MSKSEPLFQGSSWRGKCLAAIVVLHNKAILFSVSAADENTSKDECLLAFVPVSSGDGAASGLISFDAAVRTRKT